MYLSLDNSVLVMVSSSMFMLSSIIKHILITFWKQFLKMTIHKGKPAPNPDREENFD